MSSRGGEGRGTRARAPEACLRPTDWTGVQIVAEFFVRGIDSVLLEPKHLVVAAFLGAMVSDNVQLSKLEVFRLDYMQDQASVDKRFDCRILMSRVANVLLPDNAQTAGLWFEIHSRDRHNTLSR